MARSVRVDILLLLTLAGCASKGHQAASAVEGPANTQAERQAFQEQGLVAPDTAVDARQETAPLDLAKLAEAFGPATEATPDEVARLAERRNVERTVAIESTTQSPGDDGEADESRRPSTGRGDRPSGNFAVELPAPPPQPPPPRAPAAEPVPEAKAEDPAKNGERSRDFKEAEKKKRKVSGAKDSVAQGGADYADDMKQTLLPAIERRPTLGKVLVRGGDGKLVPLIARAVRVVAHVQGSRARTVVDYVFENPHDRRLQGTFYHPLPADASPAGFAMFDGTQAVSSSKFFRSNGLLPNLPRGPLDALTKAAPSGRSKKTVRWGAAKSALVVEQKRARQVYEEIVRSEVDPALLEWAGGSNFEARVFPIEPKSLKRVVVAYEQPLVFDGAQYRYAYTLPTVDTIVERGAALIVDTTKGEIVAAPAAARRTDGKRWTRFDVASPDAGATMEIAVKPQAANTVLRGRDRSGLSGDAFYAQIRPELPAAADRSTGRAILMVDTSLSSEEGDAHGRRAKLIQALLEQDKSIEQYAVMLFDVRPRWLHQVGWRSNTPGNRAATNEELRRVYLEGATSFSSVLAELEAQKDWAVAGEPTTVFLLSDGEITWGLDRPEALPSRHPILGDVRWVTYRFGEAPANAALFDLLSRASGGQTVSVLSSNDIQAAALAHRRVPVSLESVVVEGAASVDVVVRGQPRLVFPGQTLTVAGRLPKGGDASLVVTLASGGSSKALRIPLAANADDSFAPRAWAELHTRKLVALDDPRVDRMVVALSQHYRLANARASFLILENEGQVKQYDLKNETVDLSDLEKLRDAEADQRRAELLGLGMGDVDDKHRQFLALVSRISDGVTSALAPQPLLDLPYVGGPERMQAEVAYRAQRDAQKNDVLLYEGVARARALAGDTAGAVRALSTTVELRPRDTEAMRLVGYALLAIAQYDVATELFERVRLLRPFEPQSFLEEALALDAAGRYRDAARNYEIVLARSWPRHGNQAQTAAALHYARLLTILGTNAPAGAKKSIEARVGELVLRETSLAEPMDFQLTTHWSTDSVDIDLWVFEPSGEKCSYENRETASGGRLLWDITDGLGPEVYQASKTMPGPYDTLVHFYGSGAPKMQAPTALLMVVDEAPWTRAGVGSRKFLMRMLPKRDAVLMMRTDYFAGS